MQVITTSVEIEMKQDLSGLVALTDYYVLTITLAWAGKLCFKHKPTDSAGCIVQRKV